MKLFYLCIIPFKQYPPKTLLLLQVRLTGLEGFSEVIL